MKIQTPRLILTKVVAEDADAVHALHLLPETDQYNTLGIPENKAQTEKLVAEWIAANQESSPQKYTLRITDHNNLFVGLIGIKMGKPTYRIAEIWYKLHSSHWNKGYATEALNGVLEFCFNELELHRIEAGCAVENIASAKVLEKAGFLREGRHRKILPIRGQWHDNFSYAILEEDFANQKR